MSRYPISHCCPRCSAREHTKVKPDAFVAYKRDRVCWKCSTRYSPPTPIWASVLICLLGTAGVGVFATFLAAGVYATVFTPILFLVGVVGSAVMAVHGVRLLLTRSHVPSEGIRN